MRTYEFMIIVNPDVDDRKVQALVEKPLDVITKSGGSIDSVEVLGRRRLAYDIQKKSEGSYVVLNVTAEPAAVKELDRLYTLNEQIMRTKVIRPDTHA